MPSCVSGLPSVQHTVGAEPVAGVTFLGGGFARELLGPTLKSWTLPLPHRACVLPLPHPPRPQDRPSSHSTVPLRSSNSQSQSAGSLTSAGHTSPLLVGLSGLARSQSPCHRGILVPPASSAARLTRPEEDALSSVIAFFMACQQINYRLIGIST